MSDNSYIRPLGIIPAPELEDGERFFGGLPLTGDGALFYTAAEIIERQDSAVVSRKLISLGELWEKDLSNDGARVAEMLERISDSRSRLSGLDYSQPIVMGIVNVTPDSFSDGGQFSNAQDAIDHGKRLEDEGALILDIGGESTRPGADAVPLDEELRRVMPVIEGLSGHVEARISIDTRKSDVMRRAAEAGVDIINDVSALVHDPDSLAVAADTGLPIILMHARGDPGFMQNDPVYEDVVLDVFDFLNGRIRACEEAGIGRSRLVADPGIGFGKTAEHNLALIHGLSLFHGLGVPLLIGASRKRFIGAITGEADAKKRLPGSLAAALSAVGQGVQIIRVHDVEQTVQALKLWRAIETGQGSVI